ncbi:MAG: galactose mutarotase [Clostridium sp.]|jgi:aldose 1-epimerase|uniref:aldose epimerase family protein n=1 Tax=Clostridium sp. TaxID=1506 RepID=UPI0025C4092C|nr:aldose epimerase family protein [Clostridium sp.]MCH3965393.1 galactose mutarotase [Clostridium sp.]MCI1717379.1 galactose mutarotase [Clostridium sp.]MCI1801714.1 galactose mutarotase [Clostridium sp.]MCI1815565.1 galactose mutarotase [Clostridium sp.]MCI1872463.1 galactose mutarotase [Clostridium sp.]
MIEKSILGSFDGNKIYKYTIENIKGVKVSCISYGATLTEIIVPDQFNNFSNILLNFDDLESYINDKSIFLGASIGPVAGRITNGCFKINGIDYKVSKNESNNTLHGGSHGFNTLLWNSKTIEAKESNSIIFYRTITNKEDSFPGTRDIKITYTLNDNNDLSITFNAVSSKDTLFNPTVHSYFNLNNDVNQLLSGHFLKINASHYAEIDKNLLPTGILRDVSGTLFDFRQSKNLKDTLNKLNNDLNIDGLDHPFNVNCKNVVCLVNHNTGRRLDIESDRNGLIVYTLNGVKGVWKIHGQTAVAHMGIALEPQTLPDAINHTNFGDIILPKNTNKEYNIRYHFSLI